MKSQAKTRLISQARTLVKFLLLNLAPGLLLHRGLPQLVASGCKKCSLLWL